MARRRRQGENERLEEGVEGEVEMPNLEDNVITHPWKYLFYQNLYSNRPALRNKYHMFKILDEAKELDNPLFYLLSQRIHGEA